MLSRLEARRETDMYFSDINKDPAIAVLLYYLNAGFLTFGESDEYDQGKENAIIPEDSLIKEIQEEMLSSQELTTLVSRFSERHSFLETTLLSCGACGIRDMPSSRIKFHQRLLGDLHVLKYDEPDRVKLRCFIRRGGINITIDEDRNLKHILPWKLISYFETAEGELYHLHPELVDVDDNTGQVSTTLCSTCEGIVSKCEIPPLSIAAGLDFGNPSRIQELTPLNLHEKYCLQPIVFSK